MHKLIIELKIKYYRVAFSDDYKIWALGTFLTSDVIENMDFYIWATDNSRIQYGGNVGYLEKINDNVKLYIQFDDDLYESDPDKYSVLILLTNFIEILAKWHQLVDQRKNYIIITEENNKYKIEAADKLSAENQLLIEKEAREKNNS